MVIHSGNRVVANTDDVLKSVRQFTKYHDVSYALDKYIDRFRWVDEIKKVFRVEHLDNLTDFNYARCFTYVINENDLDLNVISGSVRDYVIKFGYFNVFYIMISVLGPYVFGKSLKYEYVDSEIVLSLNDDKMEWHYRLGDTMEYFCEANSLFYVDDETLKAKVDEVELELHGPNPTVYNIFFEDGASSFPY